MKILEYITSFLILVSSFWAGTVFVKVVRSIQRVCIYDVIDSGKRVSFFEMKVYGDCPKKEPFHNLTYNLIIERRVK